MCSNSDAVPAAQGYRLRGQPFIPRMHPAADIRGGRDLQELLVVRETFPDVDVEIDPTGTDKLRDSQSRLPSNSWNRATSIGTNRTSSPAAIGKKSVSGSATISGVLPISHHPPGHSQG
jgi:hypothetical protein